VSAPSLPGSPTAKWKRRRAELRRMIFDYVSKHADCTSRDVTCDVLRGSGGSHTPERALAQRMLAELVRASVLVKRGGFDEKLYRAAHHGDHGFVRGVGDAWHQPADCGCTDSDVITCDVCSERVGRCMAFAFGDTCDSCMHMETELAGGERDP
jgi:hypothetical protein